MTENEEEIIEKIKDYIELLMCDERPLELPSMFQKEWAENLQALLDLYNILKEKYNFTIKNNLDDKYEEVLEKTFKKYIDKDFISKDKIKEIRDKAEVMDYYTLTEVIDDLSKLIGDEKEIRKANCLGGLIGIDGYKEIFDNIEEYCRKDLAFKRRLERNGTTPDLFNLGRFAICDDILKILKGENK